MISSRKNRTIHIDVEALSTLALVQEGLLSPVEKLMGSKEAEEVKGEILHEANQIRKSRRIKSYNRKERKERFDEQF